MAFYPVQFCLVFSLFSAFWTQSVSAADVYLSLKEEAKRLSRPTLKRGPQLTRMSQLTSRDEIFGVNEHDEAVRKHRVDIDLALKGVLEHKISALTLAIARNSASENEVVDPEAEAEGQSFLVLREDLFDRQLLVAERSYISSIHLVPTLSRSGWNAMKLQRAEEFKLAEYLGGRHLTDFCVADAGVGMPTSASVQFSVLEYAMLESSANMLDLGLLRLLDQPDAFQLNESEDDEEEDRPSAWNELVEARQGIGPTKRIAEIARWWNVGTDTKPVLTALNQVRTSLKQQCAKNAGTWVEDFKMRPSSRDEVLFGCMKHGALIGTAFVLHFSATGQDPHAQLWIENHQGSVVARLGTIDDGDDVVRLDILLNGKSLAATLRFDGEGAMRSRFAAQGDSSHVAWDEQGRVVWSGRYNSNAQWLEDLSWSERGSPLAMFSFADNGNLRRLVEWHENGNPARFVEFQAGKPDGLELWWYEDGQQAGEVMWSAGKRFGSTRLRYEHTSVPGYEASYVGDQIDGALLWRSPAGQNVLESRFVMGRAQGAFVISNGEGVTLATATFEQGHSQGVVTLGGQGDGSKASLPFQSGLLNGDVVFSGAQQRHPRLVMPFRQGKLSGTLKAYYAPDKLAATCDYVDGTTTAWQSWSNGPESVPASINGKFIDQTRNVMTQTITDRLKSKSVTCRGDVEGWSTCIWTLNGKTIEFDKKDILPAVSAVWASHKGKSKIKRPDCDAVTTLWDLRHWVDGSNAEVSMEVIPGANCSAVDPVRCDVQVQGQASKLRLQRCKLIDDDVDHDHD